MILRTAVALAAVSLSRIIWLTDTNDVVHSFCHTLCKSHSTHICVRVLVSYILPGD